MDTVILSPSKIKTWQHCHQAFHYKYDQNLRPKRKVAPLYRGVIIHEIIEAYHRGNNWEEVFERYEAEFNKMYREEREELGENLMDDIWLIVQGYFHRWQSDPLEYIEIEGTLGPFEIAKGVYLKGKVDRIAIDQDGVTWVVDTKTKRHFPDEFERQMNLQGMIYIWLARQAGYNPVGIIWDYVRTKAPVVPEQLKNGTLSKRRNIDTTWGVYLSEIERLGLDPNDYLDMQQALKGKDDDFYLRVRQPINDRAVEVAIDSAREQGLRILETHDYPIREFNWQCSRCEYRRLCWAEMVGLDADFIRRNDFVVEVKEEDSENGEEA